MEQLQSVSAGQMVACLLGAYVLGCFASGYYLVRVRTGRDIREIESGNIGARNVGRLLGKSAFVLTALGDVGKGVLTVWATRHFTGNNTLAALAMLAVVIGHIWPAPLRFRGGKGAATSLGALLIYDPQLTLAYVISFFVALIVLRKMTPAGLCAYVCLPFFDFWLHRDGFNVTIIAILSGLVLFAHRRNLIEEIPALAARRHGVVKPEPPKL